MGRFIADRDALARRLRSAGEGAAAARVAKLRKPSVTAALVNDLVHNHGAEVERFLGAADDLEQAQQEVLQGAGAEQLREAMSRERDAINQLVEIGRSKGASAVALQRLQSTLETAASEPSARQALQAGRLERELGPAALAPLSTASRPNSKSRPGSRRKAELAGATARIAELSGQLKALERSQKELRETEQETVERLKDTRAALSAGETQTERLLKRVDSAKRKLDRARRKGR